MGILEIEMKNKEILTVTKPIIRTWNQESFLISIILLKKTAEEWLLDTYLKLYGEEKSAFIYSKESMQQKDLKREQDLSTIWLDCPFLNITNISNEFIQSNHQSIVEYIYSAIDNGYYVYFTIENNICEMDGFESSTQHIFVCGYNKEKQCIITVSHFNNKGKVFYREIDNEKLIAIYTICNLNTEKIKNYDGVIKLLRLNDYEYHSEIKPIEQYLMKYILTMDEKQLDRKTCFDIYNLIQTYIDAFLKPEENVKKDIRLFYILCDHTKVLYTKLESMYRQGYYFLDEEVVERYRMIFKMSEKIVNLFLTYWVQEDDEILISIKNLLQKMYMEEYSLAEDLYDKLF